MNKLTEREKRLCRFYALLHDPKRAAEWAGWCLNQAETVLARKEAAAFVAECERELGGASPEQRLLNGVLRLAGESTNDAVVLMLQHEELSSQQIRLLDLYGVSEFKRGSDGSVQFKLYDRLRALEMLERIVRDAADRREADDLCAALEQGAENLTAEDGYGEV